MDHSRISFVRGPHGDLQARARLTGVSEAVRRAKELGGTAAVFGPHDIEEMQAYLREAGQHPQHNFVAIGPRGLGLVEIYYREYRGRVRQLRRVLSFLSSTVFYRDEELAVRLSDGLLLWPDVSLQEQLVSSYVGSRKSPAGAKEEMDEFFIQLTRLDIQEPVVLRKYHWGWTAEQCILAAMAIKQQAPLVFITDDNFIPTAVHDFLSTEPITLGEVFDEIERDFKISPELSSRHYRLWRASNRFMKNNLSASLEQIVQVSTIGDFVNFLLEAVSTDDRSEEQIVPIPSRIVAPIMFREGDSSIGVDHTAVTGVTYQNAIGGVRALKYITQDVRDSGVLTNAVNGISSCLNRIIGVLDRIERSPNIEESSIVEFGVEFSYLESRILNAQPQLSRETMEFMLSYTGQGQALLERFEPWQTYKAEGCGSQNGLGAVNREVADAAIRVLRSAAAEGMLDKGASGRVAEMIAGADVDAPVKRASLATTSHNLGAAVGRSALAKSREFAGDVLKGAEADAKKKFSASAASFIHRHAADLARLATAESGKWLAVLLKTFGGDS